MGLIIDCSCPCMNLNPSIHPSIPCPMHTYIHRWLAIIPFIASQPGGGKSHACYPPQCMPRGQYHHHHFTGTTKILLSDSPTERGRKTLAMYVCMYGCQAMFGCPPFSFHTISHPFPPPLHTSMLHHPLSLSLSLSLFFTTIFPTFTPIIFIIRCHGGYGL